MHTVKLTVASNFTPKDVLASLSHYSRNSKEFLSRAEVLVLKVVGKEEYLLDEYHMFEYKVCVCVCVCVCVWCVCGVCVCGV